MERVEHNQKYTKTMVVTKLIILSYIIFNIAFNVHILWIVYDILILFIIIQYMKRPGGAPILFILSSFIFLSYAVFRVLLYGHVLYGLLNVWDIYKSVFLLQWMSSDKISDDLQIYKCGSLYKTISSLFFIQLLLCVYQYYNSWHFDDIAGGFGDGGSHAICYASLLAVVSCYACRTNLFALIFIVLASVLMNSFSENVGFYPLLILVFLLFYYQRNRVSYFRFLNSGFAIALIFLISFIILVNLELYHGDGVSLYQVIVSRMVNFLNINESGTEGRGPLLVLAYETGGFFGVGPGSYSTSYGLNGVYAETLGDVQLNISELTHIMVEYGLVGVFLIVVTYLSLIYKLLYNCRRFEIIIACLLFMMMFSYSSVLSNESQSLMMILVLFYLSRFSFYIRMDPKRRVLAKSSTV